ncbi:hypothetical protein FRC08_009817 [Ceratobasidium sp. 394]|nr:hypothetical protein FRC08_009817 [Ceratobasidium sp. 394]
MTSKPNVPKLDTTRQPVHEAGRIPTEHAEGASNGAFPSGRTVELSIPDFGPPPVENFAELIKSMNDEEFTQYAKEHKVIPPAISQYHLC